MNFIRRIGIGLFFFLYGCATKPPIHIADVLISTLPPGGSVTVKESGRIVEDGDQIQLPEGRYTLVSKKPGYREGSFSLKVIGKELQTVTVPLGKGFAMVTLSTAPADAVIGIDEIGFSGVSFSDDLNAGSYEIVVQHPAYRSKRETVVVEPGKPVEITFTLDKIPAKTTNATKNQTTGAVSFETSPTGGVVDFRGQQLTMDNSIAKQLPFGKYSVKATKMLDEETRLEGGANFELKNAGLLKVTVELNERKKLFEGEWLPEETVVTREEERYRRQRVKNPVHLKVSLTGDNWKGSISDLALQQALMKILRVGDRISYSTRSGEWKIWKRHTDFTLAFSKSVEDFLEGDKSNTVWPSDKAILEGSIQLNNLALDKIAYALHSKRAVHPMLDLRQDQMSENSETVYRSPADGNLTVLVMGGEDLNLGGSAEVQKLDFGLGQIFNVSKKSDPIKISWNKKPERLLVVSDASGDFSEFKSGQLALKKGEKKLLNLSRHNRVIFLKRISSGPDYQGWQSENFEATGPLAEQIDLNTDEIGPNNAQGNYQRIWIARFRNSTGKSQRQLAMAYRVIDENKEFESDQFFGRKSK